LSILGHIFLIECEHMKVPIAMDDMVDHTLAYFEKNAHLFPNVNTDVSIHTNHLYPSSGMKYCTIFVDDETVVRVHNQWNIPVSDFSVFVMPCAIVRERIAKRTMKRNKREDWIAYITSLDQLEEELVRMFCDVAPKEEDYNI
jgi:hypothetical protein